MVCMFILNMLSARGLINNTTPGELSDKMPNLFVPSGITFSVWSVIYVLLFLFVTYQARGLVKTSVEDAKYLKSIGWFFVLTNIANSCWIFAWHYELVPLSLIFMILLLVSLIAIYLRLGIGLGRVTHRRDMIFFHLPFSVYLGWITVATIANVTAVFVSVGVEPYTFLAVMLTVVVIFVATLITSLMLIKRRDVAFGLVIIWALIGIVIKRLDPTYFVEFTVASAAGLAAIVVSIITALVVLRRPKT
jgi:hypothetical protein